MLTRHIIQPLSEIKIFRPTSADFSLKFLSPNFEDRVHAMTLPNQLALKQIKKSSENDSMIAEFYKNIYQKTYLPNDCRLRISENKKVFKKSQIWLTHTLVPNLPSRNKFLVIAVKNYTEADFKVS